MLGRQIKTILNRSSDLESRVIRILENEIHSAEKSKMAELMVRGTESSIVEAIGILKEILIGIVSTS